jgi:hypothetical protein
MNTFWNKRRIILAAVILLSALVVFFMGRVFNTETLSREMRFTKS